MRQKIKSLIIVLSCLIAFMYSCKEDIHKVYGSDGKAPGKVMIDNVDNKPGGAILHYTTPNDVDLLYVKAVFNDHTGRQREYKTSAVIDSLVIEGIGAEGNYDVSVYAVDRGENVSEAATTVITPTTPPIKLVAPTLKGVADYGGIKVSYKNDVEATVALNLLAYDADLNKMLFKESFYTTQKAGDYSFRGYRNVETKFGVYIEDRWGNKSDTTLFNVTPIPDDPLDKGKFSIFRIQGDKDFGAQATFAAEQMWDDEVNSQWNCGHTDFSTSLPHHLTIDLGAFVKLSRFKLFQRTGGELYKHGNPKRFKVYGTKDVNTLPPYNADDPNAGWTFLSEFNSFKPSGLPVGMTTVEDEEYQIKGEDFEFKPDNLQEIRYIRFEILENWGGQNVSVIGELSFWGEILNSDI